MEDASGADAPPDAEPLAGRLTGIGVILGAGVYALIRWSSAPRPRGSRGSLGNLAEEMKEPERNLPRALYISLAVTTLIHVAVALSATAVVSSRWD